MLDALKILERLAPLPSPSGEETPVAEAIREIASPFAEDIRTDTLGNLIVHRPGAGQRVLLAAHMDTTGVIATHIDEHGFLRFGQIGGLSHEDLLNIPVRFTNGVEGVISCDGKVKATDRKLLHYYIDIGAADAAQARQLVSPGMRAVFFGGVRRLGEHRVCAPYLDNRAGCAVLLMALSSLAQTEYDVSFVFTVQEEVGLRGAKCAAFALEPDWALAVDVTDTGDTPEPGYTTHVSLGKGPAVKIMDRSAVSHPLVARALTETAARHGICCQQEIMTDGGTDAGAIHLSRGGVRTGGIAIPTRYIHSPCETADLRDLLASAELLLHVLENNALLP